MRICLIRHGEPLLPQLPDRIRAREFPACMEIYDASGIRTDSRPARQYKQELAEYSTIICSDLPRSIESALQFCDQQDLTVSPEFREVEQGYLSIPWLSLSPQHWAKIFILLWLLGAFRYKYTFRQARKRAQRCAQKLIELAQSKGAVMLVGHGFMNTYIARELRAMGWSGPKQPGKGYWQFGIYQPQSVND